MKTAKHASSRLHSRGLIAALLASVAALASCTVTTRQSVSSVARAAHAGSLKHSGSEMSINELEQVVNAYADRYMTLIAGACDAIKASSPSPQARRDAQYYKLMGVTSIYDIATNAEPYTELLDMVLVVTLQSIVWIDENKAETVFGADGELLVGPLNRARQEIWDIAERVMKQPQLTQLEGIIEKWRAENPDAESVAFVRFEDFAYSRGKSMIENVAASAGFLAPVDDARMVAERVFFMAKRMPILIGWEAELVVSDVLVNPDVRSALHGYEDLSSSLSRAVAVLEGVPSLVTSERREIMRDLEDKSRTLQDTLESYRAAVTDTQGLLKDVEEASDSGQELLRSMQDTGRAMTEMVRSIDQLAARFDEPTPVTAKGGTGSSFKIEEYTMAAEQMSKTAMDLNALVASMNGLVASDAWRQRLLEIDRTAGDAGGRLIDRLFKRALVLLVVFFGLLTAYRWISARIGRP